MTKLDAVLQCSHIIWIRQFDHLQHVGLFKILYPLVRLALRVDTKGPPRGVVYYNSVIG